MNSAIPENNFDHPLHNTSADYNVFVNEMLNTVNDDNGSNIDLWEKLETVKIDPAKQIPKPPTCLWFLKDYKEFPAASLGDFSLIIGKAKSKKTFAIGMMIAAAGSNDAIQKTIRGQLPKEKNRILYFDTEQSEYHVTLAMGRICVLLDVKVPENISTYHLRKFPPSERLKMIEYALYKDSDVGMVVIDGIRDLVTSINDESQATDISSKLLKWTEELGIHIMTVLHQNKNDSNARGHLGTELVNKAATVLSVEKVTDGSKSVVKAESCRGIEPPEFAFYIDDEGLPCICDYVPNKPGSKALKPEDIDFEIHRGVLMDLFALEEKPKLASLKQRIRDLFQRRGTSIGASKADEFRNYYLQKSFIKSEGTYGTKNAFYIYNL